jgi:hypothetical protein
MGYLTTITIYNDGCDSITENEKEFAEKVLNACHGIGKSYSFALGHNCNLVKCQKPRHADDHAIFLHAGNTLTEMSPYSLDTVHALEVNPEAFKRSLDFMEAKVKELKKMYKNRTK